MESEFISEKIDKLSQIYKECTSQFADAIDSKALTTFDLETKLDNADNQGYAKVNEGFTEFDSLLGKIKPISLKPSHALMVDILANGRPFALGEAYIPDPEGKMLVPHVAMFIGYKRYDKAPGGVTFLVRNAWGIPPVWAHVELNDSHSIIAIGKK